MTVQRGVALPAITDVALQCSPFAYVVPVILFIVGMSFLRKRDGGLAGFECTISVTWLLALFWALFNILAWELPRVEFRGIYIR
jgi:hypothetical protein